MFNGKPEPVIFMHLTSLHHKISELHEMLTRKTSMPDSVKIAQDERVVAMAHEAAHEILELVGHHVVDQNRIANALETFLAHPSISMRT